MSVNPWFSEMPGFNGRRRRLRGPGRGGGTRRVRPFQRAPPIPSRSLLGVQRKRPSRAFLQLVQQCQCLAQQVPDRAAFCKPVLCKYAMLPRIPVAPRRAGSCRAAVHAAARLAVHGRRAAKASAAGPGAAAPARPHRLVAAGSAVAHAVPPCVTSARSRSPASRGGINPVSPAVSGLAASAPAGRVALPPSRAGRLCTVIARSPLLR